MDITLNDQQKRFFDVFGYLVLPGLIADIIDEVTMAFEAVFVEKGVSHDPSTGRSLIVPFIDQSERLSLLVDDSRIRGLAASLLGEDFNYLSSDGNYYVGNTNWHTDGGHQAMRFAKIAIYLDAVDATSGALRVIPGTHHAGDAFARSAIGGLQKYAAMLARATPDTPAEDLAALTEAYIATPQISFGMAGDQLPATVLSSQPGDVVVFNHNILHSSWGGDSRRRMFTLNLSEHAAESQLPELRSYIGGFARFEVKSMIGPAMLAGAGPERMVHLEQALANNDVLAAQG